MTFRRTKQRSLRTAFENEFALEVLRSDQLRVTILIEKLNKNFGSQLLISDNVWQSLGDVIFKATPMGDVHVKGREGAIQIYQVA